MADSTNIGRSYVSIVPGTGSSLQEQISGGLPSASKDFIGPIQSGVTPINLRYPHNLGQKPYEKWILFEARAGRHILRNTIFGEDGASDRTLASAALYLPVDALNSSLTVQYQESPLGEVAGPLLEAAVQGTNAYQRMGLTSTDKPIDKLKKIVKAFAPSTLPSLVAAVEGRGVGAIQAALDKVVTGGSSAGELFLGMKINPRTDLLFGSVEYRAHTCTFTLVPRTQAEADEIDKIVSFFQYYMLPSFGPPTDFSQFLIGYPYEFEIRMFSEFDDLSKHHVNTIGRSVLRGCNITNSSSERVAFIEKNGELYPASTTISLQFQEVRLLGRDAAEIVRGGVNQFSDPRF